MAQPSIPKVTQLAVPANGAGFVRVYTSILASKVQVVEDPSKNAGVAQGLQGYYVDPTTGQRIGGLQTWLAAGAAAQNQASQPITFGGEDGRVHGAFAEYVGRGPSYPYPESPGLAPSTTGTPLLDLESASANATGVLISEWP